MADRNEREGSSDGGRDPARRRTGGQGGARGRGAPGKEGEGPPRKGGKRRGGSGGGDRGGQRGRAPGAGRQRRGVASDGGPLLPPRRRPPRPTLPAELPRVARHVHRDLRGTAPPKELDDVIKAVSAAEGAVEGGDLPRALELLGWAKTVAPRSVVIREALGVVSYLAGDFEAGHRELLAYRRLSDRQDQNHLLADCARATGRGDKVAGYVDDMARTPDVPAERVVEGLIVLAGQRADGGDLEGALRALGRADLDPKSVRSYHARLWYVAADLYERLGDRERAREYFEAITAVDEDFLDVSERLTALED